MAFDTYMLINDGKFKGEATAAGLVPPTGWFEIASFSWGANNPTTVGTGATGLSAGKVSVSSFSIMKKSENASALLFSACCNGHHFEKAQIVMRKATGTGGQQPFLKYEFEDVMVESIQWSASAGTGDDTPIESISFAFAKLNIQYAKQNTASGILEAGNSSSWDLTKAAKE
jgi:type VI secretion system secreted protein Hcp